MILENLLREGMMNGFITCRKCGNNLEMDAEKCHCGWVNPIRAMGMI